jgi:hypothetical protein
VLAGFLRWVPVRSFDRISRLQSENETLKRQNSGLLEEFVVWQYNAYKYGMKEHQLNAPLPRIDREITVKPLTER